MPGGFVTDQRSINSRLRRLRVNRKAWIASIEPLTFSPRQRLAVRTPFGDFTMEDADRNLTRIPNKPRGLAELERTREITAPSVFDTNGRDNSAYGLKSRFEERGFSERAIKTLVDAGVDAPERLLFMTDVDLKSINGLGNSSLDEIDLYRSRFSPPPLSAEDRIKIAVIRRKFYPGEGTAVLAAKTGISKNAARAVDLVVREAVPEVVEAVEQGNVPLREARIIRYLPPETQKEYVRSEVKPP